jgi:predicted ATPase
MPNGRFVLTGGPGAGKTTTMEALATRGFHSVPDSARAIIRQRKEAGLSPRPSLVQFGREILRRDIAQYRTTTVAERPVFFDRGVGDAVALLFLQGALTAAEAKGYLTEFRYNALVFVFPPWPDIYHTDAERDQSFAHAVAVDEEVRTWYTQWHYTIVEVPRRSVDERADFILRTIQEARTPE